MTFTDEDSRLEYHKASTLLQMVCQVFENHCFLLGQEAEFIDLLDENVALVGLPQLNDEQASYLIEQVNKSFLRKDGEKTCDIYDNAIGVFRIYVTSSSDWSNLN